MQAKYLYPIISTADLRKTTNFYEDFFDFVPVFEMEGYVFMHRKDREDMCLALMDANHADIPEEFRKPAQGLILNFPVDDVHAAYEACYMEGLDIRSEPAIAACGRRHFFVTDPNGILIDVMQEYDPFINEQDPMISHDGNSTGQTIN